ncbi:SigB/SigF/SigG family RNA polymerase sigma factor [Paractinoplanes atraurantiacus]|uniref:RNA polymerase sigma-B factor n=1 Tax=Paractinoplanes atraurantiacus TaxID=1036182 RepID=A0A285K2E2_9ACTN|nr:SigB/SigF/SigG family RNA polymerase sigma factor [Actinoplanes atraurantiacus]SNY66187.1 RNA polymerase sigma-B factor [Actinoplanes atraurantiacus]
MTTVAVAPPAFTDPQILGDARDLVAAVARLSTRHPAYPALRARAIEAWLSLARHLAYRYIGRGEPAEDLLQVAALGLVKAVDRYDGSRGVEFTTFAVPTIVGELKRHFRDRTWSVRVPRRLQELRSAIAEADNDLTHRLGRRPTVADLAEDLRIGVEEVIEGMEGASAYTAASLSAPTGADGESDLASTLGVEERGYALVDLRLALGPALDTLDEREQRILARDFYGNLTQRQIAELEGISQMHVSRLRTRALAKLRRYLEI